MILSALIHLINQSSSKKRRRKLTAQLGSGRFHFVSGIFPRDNGCNLFEDILKVNGFYPLDLKAMSEDLRYSRKRLKLTRPLDWDRKRLESARSRSTSYQPAITSYASLSESAAGSGDAGLRFSTMEEQACHPRNWYCGQ
jgi:hypothetical protein